MDEIKKLYKKWTAGEWDEPFTTTTTWRGDLVEGFVKFCLKDMFGGDDKAIRSSTLQEVKEKLNKLKTSDKLYDIYKELDNEDFFDKFINEIIKALFEEELERRNDWTILR